MSNFDQRTMRDAWECWRASEHLRDVLTTYGGREQQQAMALPRIRWEPTRDSFSIAGRGEMSIQPREDGDTNKQSYVIKHAAQQARLRMRSMKRHRGTD